MQFSQGAPAPRLGCLGQRVWVSACLVSGSGCLGCLGLGVWVRVSGSGSGPKVIRDPGVGVGPVRRGQLGLGSGGLGLGRGDVGLGPVGPGLVRG